MAEVERTPARISGGLSVFGVWEVVGRFWVGGLFVLNGVSKALGLVCLFFFFFFWGGGVGFLDCGSYLGFRA